MPALRLTKGITWTKCRAILASGYIWVFVVKNAKRAHI